MCSLSSLCLDLVSLWTSSPPATGWQAPVDPLFTSWVSLCSEPVHDTEHRAPCQASFTGLQGCRGWHNLLCLTGIQQKPSVREAHLTLRLWYLLCISGVLLPKARQCFLLWVSVSSAALPGESLWGAPSVLWLSCPLCAVVISCVLWSCPPILWSYVKYAAARNCCFLYTELRLWSCCDFPSPTCELPLLCVTEIPEGVIVAETTPWPVMMVIWWM